MISRYYPSCVNEREHHRGALLAASSLVVMLLHTLGACVPAAGGPPVHQYAPRAAQTPEASDPEVADPEVAAPWKEALAELRSIPQLWDAQNTHQDHLGRALALARPRRFPPMTTGARQEPVTPRPGPREGVPGPKSTPPGTNPSSSEPGLDSLCHRICQHVAAICYASGRICGIAARVGDLPAHQACRRAGERCQEAQHASRRRCTPCR